MGTWNVGIFQNDIADDVKDEYIDCLREGLSDEEADKKVIKNNLDIINLESYDSVEFWLGLAMIEWKYGRLQEHTKQKAMELAIDDKYLELWKDEGEKIYKARVKEIDNFIVEIQSEQPPKKKVKIYVPFQCPWNIGDIFAYQLKSEISAKEGFLDKYILFQKVGEVESFPKSYIPVIRIANAIFDQIPTVEDYLNSKKLIFFGTPDLYKKKDLIIYKNNFLYDLIILVESLRSYPKNIVHIGNSIPIQKEYKESTPPSFGSVSSTWKGFEECFFYSYNIWHNVDEKEIL